jgi:hypothetical protein
VAARRNFASRPGSQAFRHGHTGEKNRLSGLAAGESRPVASVRSAVREEPVKLAPGSSSCFVARPAVQHPDDIPRRGTTKLTRAARNLIVLGVLAVLAMPTPALASANQVLRDCIRDGKLDRKYSNEELRKAKDNLPADSDEYSDCGDVISSAIKGGSDRGKGAGGPGVGGTDPAGEAAARTGDQGELSAIASGGGGDPPKVDVGGTSLEPDSSGFFNLAGAANEVPLPLLFALILLALLALASGLAAVRERVPALARIPLLSKIPAPRVPFFQRRR